MDISTIVCPDKIRNTTQWELISIPTVADEPIYPSKILFCLIGIISGLTFGSLIALIKEKRSGLILDENILFSYLDNKPILNFTKQDKDYYPNDFQIQIDEITKDYELINFVFTSNCNLDLKNNFSSFLSNYSSRIKKEINIINFDDTLESKNNLIIVTCLDDLRYKEIMNLKNRIKLLDCKLISIFLID